MKKKILLVEDDPSAAEILSLRLRDAGYGVAVAPNGVNEYSTRGGTSG